MRIATIAALLLFTVAETIAQNNYRQLQKMFRSYCGDTIVVENEQHDIAITEKYLALHPTDYKAWNSLAFNYYKTARQSDSLVQLSINAGKKFIETCPARLRWYGYWNVAMFYSYLQQCPEALQAMQTAKQLFRPGKRNRWDSESEKWLLKQCYTSLR